MSASAKGASRKRRNGLAAFRALELEVHAALSAGRTVLAIYEEKRDPRHVLRAVREVRAAAPPGAQGSLPDGSRCLRHEVVRTPPSSAPGQRRREHCPAGLRAGEV